jgi:HSP20 family protein
MADTQTVSTTETTSTAAADARADSTVTVKPAAATAPANGDHRTRRWDPFETRDELYHEMARMWSQAFGLTGRPLSLPSHRLALAPRTWAPSTDVYEQDGSMIVKAELPGIRKEDIEVSLDRGNLIIRGHRTVEHNVKEEQYHRMERSYGSFYRRIPLPAEVKADQFSASYNHGVLEVRVPLPVTGQTGAQKIPLS